MVRYYSKETFETVHYYRGTEIFNTLSKLEHPPPTPLQRGNVLIVRRIPL